MTIRSNQRKDSLFFCMEVYFTELSFNICSSDYFTSSLMFEYSMYAERTVYNPA